MIDAASGKTKHEYAYLLTTGSSVSEIVALNSHEFLVDERDGKGRGDDSNAKIKQIFKIDLANAGDVMNMDGIAAAANAVSKTLFLDIVAVLGATTASPPISFQPSWKDSPSAKMSRMAESRPTPCGLPTTTISEQDFDGLNTNPNNFYVFGFTDLGGSIYVPQPFRTLSDQPKVFGGVRLTVLIWA